MRNQCDLLLIPKEKDKNITTKMTGLLYLSDKDIKEIL